MDSTKLVTLAFKTRNVIGAVGMESVLTDMCCFSNRAQQQQHERDGLFHFRSTAVSCFDEPSNHKSTCIQSVIQFSCAGVHLYIGLAADVR